MKSYSQDGLLKRVSKDEIEKERKEFLMAFSYILSEDNEEKDNVESENKEGDE